MKHIVSTATNFVRTYYVTEYSGDDSYAIKELVLNGIRRSLLCAKKELCDMMEENEDEDDLEYYHEKYQRAKRLVNRGRGCRRCQVK